MHCPSDTPTAALSRRTLAKAAVGLAVAGFHAGSGQWVAAAADRPGDPFARIPRLDGTLLVDEASRQAAGQDFGQLVFEPPAAVLRPGSVDDVARMVRFARHQGIRVVGRGAAHSTFGQAQHRAGLAIDLTSLDRIGPIAGATVTVDAGCRWRAVLAATLAAGLMPPVLPDYIGQTVGGTLSVGGIGAMSFRDGAQIDHVVALLVGDGRWPHRGVLGGPPSRPVRGGARRPGPGRHHRRGDAATRAGAGDGARLRPAVPGPRRPAR